jgi:predicted esterase
MSTQDLGFVHRFVPAQNDDRRTLLLLHGTGGTEDDLLDIGRALLPTAALLSPRGKVLENGMPALLPAFAEGVFDIEDLKTRTHELADFVSAACTAYSLDAQTNLCRRLFQRCQHRGRHFCCCAPACCAAR